MNITLFIPEWLLILVSVLASIKITLDVINLYLDWKLGRIHKS